MTATVPENVRVVEWWCPKHRRPLPGCLEAWIRRELDETGLDACADGRRERRPTDRQQDRECIDCRARIGPMDEWTLYDATLGRAFRPYCYPCGSKAGRVERSIRG